MLIEKYAEALKKIIETPTNPCAVEEPVIGGLYQFKPHPKWTIKLWFLDEKYVKPSVPWYALYDEICFKQDNFHTHLDPKLLADHIAECIDPNAGIFYFVSDHLYTCMGSMYFEKIK